VAPLDLLGVLLVDHCEDCRHITPPPQACRPSIRSIPGQRGANGVPSRRRRRGPERADVRSVSEDHRRQHADRPQELPIRSGGVNGVPSRRRRRGPERADVRSVSEDHRRQHADRPPERRRQ
jgi:hypothetical protein